MYVIQIFNCFENLLSQHLQMSLPKNMYIFHCHLTSSYHFAFYHDENYSNPEENYSSLATPLTLSRHCKPKLVRSVGLMLAPPTLILSQTCLSPAHNFHLNCTHICLYNQLSCPLRSLEWFHTLHLRNQSSLGHCWLMKGKQKYVPFYWELSQCYI